MEVHGGEALGVARPFTGAASLRASVGA